jgi:hypothetical protein
MLQTTTPTTDTLPQAQTDYFLDYLGNSGTESRCRIRVYERAGGPTVIVATELPTNPGASVTNTAERVHYLAWERAGKPPRVVFVEHYPGRPKREGQRQTTSPEELDEVRFPIDEQGIPRFSQRMLYPGRWETQFGEADWRPLGREALLSLIEGSTRP